MVQLGIACITAYEGCFDLILTRSTTLIVLNGKSEGAGVAKLKQVMKLTTHLPNVHTFQRRAKVFGHDVIASSKP